MGIIPRSGGFIQTSWNGAEASLEFAARKPRRNWNHFGAEFISAASYHIKCNSEK